MVDYQNLNLENDKSKREHPRMVHGLHVCHEHIINNIM